ncbi:hypothetical protein [Natronolimnobius sp. AArcel1]|uniref:hypothetical protein n=1 Tax=Natronolimnobius sp. AArcel1 TaxID=1679093 RepID=UPI0019D27B1F|nr:hypothetical protein [Natronolimnobius sp. AArcel1]
MPEAESLEQARVEAAELSDDSVPADPEVLAKEVEKLKAGQETMMAALTEAKPGAASDGNWLTAGTKGVFGSLAGAGAGAALGAAAGSVIPVVGTATGAAVGAAVSGAASDLTKEGIDYLVDNRPDGKPAELERMYQEISEMYAELKDERALTGQETEGVGKSGAVRNQ